MKWREQWRFSFRNLFAAPVRSLLMVLGMSIVIGAILAVLTLGTAGRDQVRAEMTRLGIDRVWLTAVRSEEPLMRGDGALLERELGVSAAEQRVLPVKIAVGERESESALVGCSPICLQMTGAAVVEGTALSAQEWRQGGSGILLGEALAAELNCGPGTLVITAVVFFANRPSTLFCTGLMNRPDSASTAKASSGW